MFKVSRYASTHTCQKFIWKQDHKQTKSWVIVELIKLKYQDVNSGYRLKEIIQDFLKEYKVDITYVRAWRAREAALSMVQRFSPRKSYTLLACMRKCWWFNSSTHYDLEMKFQWSF